MATALRLPYPSGRRCVRSALEGSRMISSNHSDMMVSNSSPSTARIRLRVPVIVMVLAATAIPIELRPLNQAALSFGIFASDVLANVAGYMPLGFVLGELGAGRALVIAVLMSTLAEAGQLGMMYRDPSAIDVAANAIGAVLGS